MQPQPRGGVRFGRAMDAPRPGQPQRHAGGDPAGHGRLAAAARATSFASAGRNWFSCIAWPRPLPIPARSMRPLTDKDGGGRRRGGRGRQRAGRRAARPRSPTAAGRRGSSSRAKGKRTQRRLEDGPRPRPSSAGWPSSWPRPRTRPPWPTWRCAAWPRARRPTPGPCCCCPTTITASRAAEALEVVASRSSTERSLPPDRRRAGRHRDARGRGRAGPERDGRQHPGQPRQPGR